MEQETTISAGDQREDNSPIPEELAVWYIVMFSKRFILRVIFGVLIFTTLFIISAWPINTIWDEK